MTNRKLFAIAAFALMILFGAALAGCNPSTPCPTCPTCVPTPTVPAATPTATPIPILWDERLTEIGVTVNRVSGARYVLVAAWLTKNGSWDDVPAWAKQWQLDSLGGDHNAFGRCLDKVGNVVQKTFVLSWPSGSDSRTPESDGWANLPLSGNYWDPAKGPGAYTWTALNGDVLVGIDMPHNWHWSFFGVWQERQDFVPSNNFERDGSGYE